MTGSPSGVLILNKPAGMTSHDVVNKVRKLYGIRQVGHTGTLDPMATGVLVVLVGRAVKASEYVVADDKEYVAGLKLGITTDTEDTTGKILSKHDGEYPDFRIVSETVKRFTGCIEQIPPMYSAIKIDGKKLVDLARKGLETERRPRPVNVYRAELIPTDSDRDYFLAVKVSKGTYMRTLCADMGKALGVGGVMSSLVRTCQGNFGIEEALSLADIENMSEENRIKALRPVDILFSDCGSVVLTDFFASLAKNGCQIYQKKTGTSFASGELVKLCDENGFFALGQVTEYPDGSAIKPVKQLRL